ncbi:MAG: hypothetical protein HZA54_21060 [Planctomycetes bacterium]|nr:hypothetical protein [Planctomycetota bacterium]
MTAAPERTNQVACPCCASARYTRLRREVLFDHMLRISCLCATCSRIFSIREDRFGRRFP